MVDVILNPAGDASEEQIVAPALQPPDQVPWRNAQDRLSEGDRIEAGISEALYEPQAIGFGFSGLQRAERRSSGARQSRLGLLHALLLQPARNLRRVRRRQRKSRAAAAHGGEQPVYLRAHEQKDRSRRGLLKAFEQRVLRVRVHRVCRVDQDDAKPGPMRSDREKTGQLANLLDADLFAAFLLLCRLSAFLLRLGRHAVRQEQPEVRVVALRKPAACRASAAAPPVPARLLAQKRLRDFLRELQFTPALGTPYQDRVREPLPDGEPCIPRGILPAEHADQQRVEMIASISFLTSAKGLLPSTTRSLRGSAAARSR